MFDPSKYVVAAAKPLPVLLLLDVSGSMDEVVDPENCRNTGRTVFSDGQTWNIVTGGMAKRELLNKAVQKMISEFSKEERTETEFLVSVITFGDSAKVHIPFTKASDVKWEDFHCDGNTSLGQALSLAKSQIEDRTIVPSRSFRPTVVLVSTVFRQMTGRARCRHSCLKVAPQSASAWRWALRNGMRWRSGSSSRPRQPSARREVLPSPTSCFMLMMQRTLWSSFNESPCRLPQVAVRLTQISFHLLLRMSVRYTSKERISHV